MQQSGVGSSTSGEMVEEGFMEELSFQEQDRPGQVKIREEGDFEEPKTGLRCFRRKGGQWSGHSCTRLGPRPRCLCGVWTPGKSRVFQTAPLIL